MKPTFGIGILLVCAIVSALGANAPRTEIRSPYQQGTILSVQKSEVQPPAASGGDNPSDAPPHCDYYAYEVAVRVNCGTYVGRYQSPNDYFPAAFVPDHTLPVRITRHVLYFNLPGDQEMQMNIVRHKEDQQMACSRGSEKP
jgi:hypothetical protein